MIDNLERIYNIVNYINSEKIVRIKKIGIREIPYRVQQIICKRIDRYLPFSSKKGVFSQDIIKQVGKHFAKPLFSGKKIDAFFNTVDIESFNREIEGISKQHITIFGIETNWGQPINFHLDPESGNSWPKSFYDDIDFRGQEKIGEIKFVWELNRLQHWPKLALAHICKDSNRYLEQVFYELEEWLEANPYPYGVNWISGIESGIRLVNLFYTLKIIDCNSLDDHQKKMILQYVSLHANHLYRYPSKYSSCANHALAEALGLFVAGLAFPYLKNAYKWKIFAKKVLEREVARQILSDGSSFEHTIPYLQFVWDHYLVYFLLCREYNENISGKVEERLKSICTFISSIIDIQGNVPLIGDNDDGFLLKLWFGKHNNFLSLLTTGALLFKQPKWLHPAASFDSKTFLVLGESYFRVWERLKRKQHKNSQPQYFPDAGLAVIVDNRYERDLHFVGNSGPLGLRPMAGHGHADALSFWLSIDGNPVFVDPGNYLYYGGGKWRKYFRSTAAHNTVQVDNRDQSEQISAFMFKDLYTVGDVKWCDENDKVFWGAEHDGYKRLKDPVVHRREVTYLKFDRKFEIVDLLRCQELHNIKIIFHLHPSVRVQDKKNNTLHLSNGAVSILLRVDPRTKLIPFSASENPIMGWYAPGFNSLKKNISLVFAAKIEGDSVFKSEIEIL